MMTLWKMGPAEILESGLDVADLVAVNDLAQYGITGDVIDGLVKYQIMPDCFLIDGEDQIQTRKQDIFGLVEKFMLNNLNLYTAVAQAKETKETAQKVLQVLQENTFKLTDDDIAQLESGVKLSDLLLGKKERGEHIPEPLQVIDDNLVDHVR
jgi:hypothetical protein